MSAKIYDYNTCYEIAKKYICSSDFEKGNGSAYMAALKNKWIKDYTWFVRKRHKPFTYEECYEIAKKYKRRSDFKKGDGSAYRKAKVSGWLDDYTWLPLPTEHSPGWWTKERVLEESKKYKTTREFYLNAQSAYVRARKNGWLKEITWLLKDKRLDILNDKIDCVYVYEFSEFNVAYVGRTLMKRVKARDKEHLFNDKDSVSKFCREKDIPIPDMKILEKDLTVPEGVDKEGYYIELYKQNGWILLNKTRAGSIGLIARGKWGKKSCYKEALKYKNRTDFCRGTNAAYQKARIEGWLKDYTWFEENCKPNGYWDVYENCYNAAKECKTVREFCKKYGGAYRCAKKNDWVKDYVWLWHPRKTRKWKGLFIK